MWNEQKILHYLQLNLNEKRLNHSLNVSETAVVLAIKYGENIESAKIAGLIHDCAKNMKDDQLIKVARDHGIHIDEIYINNPSILHGVVGSIIAREVMKIKDDDILNAVAYHTTGRENMSKLEKIIYISDYIEPSRIFQGVEELRTLSMINLNEAVIQSLGNTIIYVVNKKELLHIDTIYARNYLLSKNRRCKDE